MLAEVGVVISGIILFARDVRACSARRTNAFVLALTDKKTTRAALWSGRQTSTCAEQFPKMVTATEVITYINMSVIIAVGIVTCCIFDPLSVPWSVDIDDPVEFAAWKREHGRRCVARGGRRRRTDADAQMQTHRRRRAKA